MIFTFLEKKALGLLSFPKKILKEFFIASLTIIKDRDLFFQKIIDKDLVAIEELTSLIISLQVKDIVPQSIDANRVSKLIFSNFFLDLVMYIFDNRINKDDAFKSTKENITFLTS